MANTITSFTLLQVFPGEIQEVIDVIQVSHFIGVMGNILVTFDNLRAVILGTEEVTVIGYIMNCYSVKSYIGFTCLGGLICCILKGSFFG